MSTSKDLLLAILAMDSYNQGYGKRIDHGKTQIGNATKKTDSTLVFTDPNADPKDTPPDEAAGFYAVSYTTPYGKVISYRGTDDFSSFAFANDFISGWVTDSAIQSSQFPVN